MNKKWLILIGLGVAGLAIGIAGRGYSDAQGWTTGTA